MGVSVPSAREIAEAIRRDYKGSYMLARASDLLVSQADKISTLEDRIRRMEEQIIRNQQGSNPYPSIQSEAPDAKRTKPWWQVWR